jgi:DNA polymerase-3 subunit delta
MFGKIKLIIIQEIERLPSKGLKPLLKYIQNPSPFSILILVTKKADLPLKKAIKQSPYGEVLSATPLLYSELYAWIDKQAKELNLKISYEAKRLLVELTGTNLGLLVSALEKLLLFCGPHSQIDEDLVEQIISPSGSYTIFELLRTIGSDNLEGSLKILKNLRAYGEPALKILWWITHHFRQICIAKDQNEVTKLAQRIKVSPKVASYLIKEAKRFSFSELKNIFTFLLRCDFSLKSLSKKDDIILEEMCIRLKRREFDLF